jgi:ABC-type uncharacterized transport system substrate-binding protein
MLKVSSTATRALGAFLCATAMGGTAMAHPHVWVVVQTTVVYEKGTVTALEQRWTFDELYSAMAVDGLDTNKDGTYDRSELAELVKVNLEGLKDFDYFTQAKLGEQKLEFADPVDAYMDYKEAPAPGPQQARTETPAAKSKEQSGFWANLSKSITGSADNGKGADVEKPKVLSFVFKLPLKQPVLADAKGFSFSTFDPTFFIAFELAKGTPVTLGSGAPTGCKALVADPTKSMDDVARLGEGAFGGGQMLGFSTAKTITLSCPGT